ncbi:MAG: ATP-binding protein [Candidatus Paceibacterota bacterium]
MKKRALFNELEKYLDRKESLVITGMRQVGKTTLMHQLYDRIEDKSKLWFDFENPLDVKVFEDVDYNNIYNRIIDMAGTGEGEKLFVCIDEIQIFPEVTKVIKYLIDHYQVKFILTGSSNFYLKNLFPESLSGRKFLFKLEPLSFKEYLYFHNRIESYEMQGLKIHNAIEKSSLFYHKEFETDYEDFLQYGGFPAVVLEKDRETKKMILKNIFASFFEKDLKMLSDYKDIQELRDLILLLLPRVGSLLNVTRISDELGISRAKVYDYLEFLQSAFIIKLLPRYSKGLSRSVAGGKKVYFSDTGLLNMIGSVNGAQLFENGVVNQMSKYGKMSFYNKRNKEEIDLVLENKMAFEIKLKGIERDHKKVKNISEKLGIAEAYVISKEFVDEKGFVTPVVF